MSADVPAGGASQWAMSMPARIVQVATITETVPLCNLSERIGVRVAPFPVWSTSMRTASYLRMSLDPTGLAAGIQRQREDTTALAASLGWTIVGEYADNDASATNLRKPRPQYERMLDDIENGRLDAVVVWHPDRLYRQPRELEHLIELCERRHVVIRTVQAGELDLSTPTGRMVARILGAVAAQEVEHKVERWRRSIMQRRRNGEWSGTSRRLFGYTRDGKIIENEAAIIRRVVERYLSGESISCLVKYLRDNRIPTTRGNEWSRQTLHGLLSNPRIAGYSVFQGEIVCNGDWEPIVDKETWSKLKTRLSKFNGDIHPRKSLLVKVIRHHCGAKMTTHTKKERGQRRVRVYRCPTEPIRGTVGCRNGQIVAVPLEEYVESYARTKLDDPRFRRAVADRISNGRAAKITAEIDEMECRLVELESELANARGRAATAIVTAMTEIEKRVDAARAKLGAMADVKLPDIGEWPSDVPTRAALIAVCVERVIIMPCTRPGRGFKPERVQIIPVTLT